MKSYLEISVTANENQRELLIPTMIELGARGFMETDSELLCYFDKTRWTETQIEHLQNDIAQILRTVSSNAQVKMNTVREENWNAKWERTIRPIEIGEKLVVKPSWAEYRNRDRKIVIQIDPKMSFGTGYHESTRLMLRLLEKRVNPGSSLLDMGTGTGILAIAAVQLGAKNAIGIDNDHWSIENAKENVKSNGLADKIRITDTPLGRLAESNFDLITANITLSTILEFLPAMTQRLKSGGVLLLSGLLVQDEETLLNELEKINYELIDRLQEGEWVGVGARKAN